MFSLKFISQKPHSGKHYLVSYEGLACCTLEEWGFRSCAVNNIFGMDSFSSVLSKHPEMLEKFITFLSEYKDPETEYVAYRAKETYFVITDSQVNYLEALVKHPKVKHLDRFLNKAHGPSYMNLFRLSNSGDFSKVP